MTNINDGDNLIFLISQPRAGSTMLQRILGGHPEIYTVAEPWIMLNPLLAIKENDVKIGIDPDNYRLRQFQNFLSLLSPENPESIYYENISNVYGSMYDQLRKRANSKFFLDKTPRYYYIIPELFHAFPLAKFIILLRNPLAVLSSMIFSWAQGDAFWFSNSGHKHDLVSAPEMLIEGIKLLGDACLVTHYENLVLNPKDEVHRITDFIGTEFIDSIIDYGNSKLPRWNYGDQNNVYKNEKPIRDKANLWKENIENYKIWHLLNDYLQILEPNVFEQMGYSYEKNMNFLDENKPKNKMTVSLPLTFLLKTDPEKTVLERAFTRFIKKRNLYRLDE